MYFNVNFRTFPTLINSAFFWCVNYMATLCSFIPYHNNHKSVMPLTMPSRNRNSVYDSAP